MRALTYHGKGDIRHERVADPEILDPRDAIIEVRLSAICGSDLHTYHGRERDIDAGTVMGHEFLGKIVETGSGVRNFKPGDVVVSPFTSNCGICHFCRIGLTCRCSNGRLYGYMAGGQGLQGGQAEYVRVPFADAGLLAVPEETRPEETLLLGDILSTGYFCAEMAQVKPDGIYAIVGCGPVGIMTLIGALSQGATRIFAIDCVQERLAKAASLGARTVDFKTEDPVQALLEATDGAGADAVMEVVGSTAAGRLAFALVRPGGILAVAGVHYDSQLPFSPVEAYDKNLTYKVGRCPARHYMDRLLPLVVSRKYALADIFSHRLPLTEGPRGYELFAQKREGCTKVLLTP